MKSALLVIVSILLSGTTTAISAGDDDTLMLDYLATRHPYLESAVRNQTYEMLARFNPFLMFRRHLKDSDRDKNFSHAILVGAFLEVLEYPRNAPKYDFSFADLAFANFSLADLSQSNFTNANAYYGDFSESILDCKYIRGLDFRGANLRKTLVIVYQEPKRVTRTILDFCGAIYDEATFIVSPLRFRSASSAGKNAQKHKYP